MHHTSFIKITPQSLHEKLKIDFQESRHSGHFGCRIGKVLDTFHLQVATQVSSILANSVSEGKLFEEIVDECTHGRTKNHCLKS